jgi:hypothetical protein
MSKNFVKFTKRGYPNGFSRNDCKACIESSEIQIEITQMHVRRLRDQLKEYKDILKAGGRYE